MNAVVEYTHDDFGLQGVAPASPNTAADMTVTAGQQCLAPAGTFAMTVARTSDQEYGQLVFSHTAIVEGFK